MLVCKTIDQICFDFFFFYWQLTFIHWIVGQMTTSCTINNVQSFVNIFNDILAYLQEYVYYLTQKLQFIFKNLTFHIPSNNIIERCQVTWSWWPTASSIHEIPRPLNFKIVTISIKSCAKAKLHQVVVSISLTCCELILL